MLNRRKAACILVGFVVVVIVTCVRMLQNSDTIFKANAELALDNEIDTKLDDMRTTTPDVETELRTKLKDLRTTTPDAETEIETKLEDLRATMPDATTTPGESGRRRREGRRRLRQTPMTRRQRWASQADVNARRQTTTPGARHQTTDDNARRRRYMPDPHDTQRQRRTRRRRWASQDIHHDHHNELPAYNATHMFRPSVWALNSSRPENGTYMIVLISDKKSVSIGGPLYTQWLTWVCYGRALDIPVLHVKPSKRCLHHSGFFFVRVCTQRRFLEALIEYNGNPSSPHAEFSLARPSRWVAFVDGDSLVVNHISMFSFLSRWDTQHIVLFERFATGTICACMIMAKASSISLTFWNTWEAMSKIERFDADNGVLHLVVLEAVRDELTLPPSYDKRAALRFAQEKYQRSPTLSTYDTFVSAVKLFLGPRRIFHRIVILRRGVGFMEDPHGRNWRNRNMTSRHLCLHGVKNYGSVERKYRPACVRAATSCQSTLNDCTLNDVSEKNVIDAFREFKSDRHSIRFNDVADCWPDCPEELGQATWQRLKPYLLESLNT